jgi:hypothetical protein
VLSTPPPNPNHVSAYSLYRRKVVAGVVVLPTWVCVGGSWWWLGQVAEPPVTSSSCHIPSTAAQSRSSFGAGSLPLDSTVAAWLHMRAGVCVFGKKGASGLAGAAALPELCMVWAAKPFACLVCLPGLLARYACRLHSKKQRVAWLLSSIWSVPSSTLGWRGCMARCYVWLVSMHASFAACSTCAHQQ